MKTTLNFNDQLLAEAKARAVHEGTTVTRLVEEGLRLRLRARGMSRAGPRRPVKLPVSNRGGGLRPGIDPRSNKSMLDAADEFSGRSVK